MPLPLVLGREGSGIVEQVGKDVVEFKKGDRVAYFKPSSYAEYTAMETNTVALLPDQISFQDGAAAVLQGLTALMLTKEAYQVKKDQFVLIHVHSFIIDRQRQEV